MPVKTTLLLKEEVYERLIKKAGRRRLSSAVNEILEKELFKPKRSMFGVDPWLTTEGLRDEDEPHEQ
ncbi:MAG: hypothetical protein FJZ49_05650 [Candidatus Verstraetearchaeota archaeon]|nr:hypothetical protein [Candidatus Verstraetearchaeota archaeon]